MLRWSFKKWNGELWVGSTRLRIGQVAGACEFGDEPSGILGLAKDLLAS
jgi:hypothetical protein